MLSPPFVDGAYPATALIEAFGVQVIASVEAVPVAVVVTAVAQAPEAIALVPSAEVPLATVPVTGPAEVLLFVSVCVSVVPTMVPTGAATDDVTVVAVAAIGI